MRPEELTPPQQADFLHAFGDHATFARESLRIRNLDGMTVPLELNPGQLKENAAIERQIKRGQPVRLVVLKTRRSGFTVGTCAEFFHRIPFLPGQKGLVIADKYNPAGMEAFDYLLQYQRNYEPFGRHGATIALPKLVTDTQQHIRWENDSKIDVLSAEGGDVGRGGGYRFVLCDEVAFWRAPEVTFTGVLNTVPDREGTIVVAQSTANGVGGEFYDLWQRACDPAQGSGWVPVFFGWLEHPVYRRKVEGDLYKFQQSLDSEERGLMDMHGATLEQLAWRRWTIDTKCRGKVDLFHQEYPTTAEEAFLTSGRPALDTKALSRQIAMPGLVGELQEDDDFRRKQTIFLPREHGALTIWRKPEPNKVYVLGGDPSGGKDVSESKRGDDPDWSVSTVLEASTGDQVALLRERLRPGEFARYTYNLGRWFNWAYCVPECNGVGLAYVEELVRLGYPLERIYRRQRAPDDRRSNRVEEIGFETTEVTRPWLINALDSALREGAITIRSSTTLTECQTFVIKPNGRMEHQSGCHDDCVLSLALAVMGLRFAPRRQNPSLSQSIDGRRPYLLYGSKQKHEDDD